VKSVTPIFLLAVIDYRRSDTRLYSTKTGVPKLCLAMYPFSISIDEHVPLNMGTGRTFFQGEANNGFSRVGPKLFLQGA